MSAPVDDGADPAGVVDAVVSRALLARVAQLERTVAARDRRIKELETSIDPLVVDVEVARFWELMLSETLGSVRGHARRVIDCANARERAAATTLAELAAAADLRLDPAYFDIAEAARELQTALADARGMLPGVTPQASPRVSRAAYRAAEDRIAQLQRAHDERRDAEAP